MNKVVLMGRLTRDPEVRYSNSAEPLAIAKYTLAVNRRLKREGEADADFIPCVAFGKLGEFAEKYLKKGVKVAISGRLSVRSWDDQSGQKRWITEVVVEELDFAESKASFEARDSREPQYNEPRNSYSAPQPKHNESSSRNSAPEGFSPIAETMDDDEDLPF